MLPSGNNFNSLLSNVGNQSFARNTINEIFHNWSCKINKIHLQYIIYKAVKKCSSILEKPHFRNSEAIQAFSSKLSLFLENILMTFTYFSVLILPELTLSIKTLI